MVICVYIAVYRLSVGRIIERMFFGHMSRIRIVRNGNRQIKTFFWKIDGYV